MVARLLEDESGWRRTVIGLHRHPEARSPGLALIVVDPNTGRAAKYITKALGFIARDAVVHISPGTNRACVVRDRLRPTLTLSGKNDDEQYRRTDHHHHEQAPENATPGLLARLTHLPLKRGSRFSRSADTPSSTSSEASVTACA